MANEVAASPVPFVVTHPCPACHGEGNPTRSYRSREPLRVKGEVTAWRGHSPEQLKAMKDGVKRAQEQGVEPIDE